MTRKKVLQKKPRKTALKPYSLYTDELAIEICDVIGTSIESLDEICAANSHFPSSRAIHLWKLHDPNFRSMYMAAKSAQSDILVEKIREIYNDTSADYIQTTNGLIGNPTAVARARLQIDSIKWLSSRLLPRIYGNKAELEESNNKQKLEELSDTITRLAAAHEREY